MMRITAYLLISCGLVFLVGGILFTGRTIWQWSFAQSQSYLYWERGWVLLAMLVNVFGITMLNGLLRKAGDATLSELTFVAYLIAATVLIVAELTFLQSREWVYPQVVFAVILTLLAQAVLGVALLQTGLVANWAGWATIVWSIGALVVLSLFSPKDMYYPALHHVAPLIIGIALLQRV